MHRVPVCLRVPMDRTDHGEGLPSHGTKTDRGRQP